MHKPFTSPASGDGLPRWVWVDLWAERRVFGKLMRFFVCGGCAQVEPREEPNTEMFGKLRDAAQDRLAEAERIMAAGLIDEAATTKGSELRDAFDAAHTSRLAIHDPPAFDRIAAFVNSNREFAQGELALAPDDAFLQRRVGGLDVRFFSSGRVYVDLGSKYGKIGVGAHKKVTKALDYDDGSVYALCRPRWQEALPEMEAELDTLQHVSDLPGVVGIREHGRRVRSAAQPSKFAKQEDVVMIQKAYATDAFEARHGGSFLDPSQRLKFAVDVVRGLHGMHNRGLLHRDIKPENLLLDDTGHGAVADFGLSSDDPTKVRGTPYYMHPDIVDAVRDPNRATRDERFASGKKHDIYALGLSLAELAGSVAARRAMDIDSAVVKKVRHHQQDKVAELQDKLGVIHAKEGRRLAGRQGAEEMRIYHDMWSVDLSKTPDLSDVLARLERLRGDDQAT